MHQWKVDVIHEVQDVEECFEEGPIIEVGVIEESENYPEARVTNGEIKRWIYAGKGNKIVDVFLNLDMDKKRLEILPNRKFSLKNSLRIRRKTFDVDVKSVLPFFSVNCPHCSLTFFMIN